MLSSTVPFLPSHSYQSQPSPPEVCLCIVNYNPILLLCLSKLKDASVRQIDTSYIVCLAYIKKRRKFVQGRS